jgi:hypothetical protein
MGSTKIP